MPATEATEWQSEADVSPSFSFNVDRPVHSVLAVYRDGSNTDMPSHEVLPPRKGSVFLAI